MMFFLSEALRLHRPAFFVAFAVGILCIFPQIAFIVSLGSAYEGIPMLQTPNEIAYVAMMQEVKDGYTNAASVPFFEYKDGYPLLPPTFAVPYAWLATAFGTSIVNVLIAGKFFLPTLLFLVVYFLVFRIIDERESSNAKLQAITTGLLIVLGFDLVDYRNIFGILFGERSFSSFLIWTRPINPISGAILFFLFLLCLWELVQKRKRWLIVLAGGVLALMMASYVFSWTLAVAVLGAYIIIAIFRRKNEAALSFALVFLSGSALALPYWIAVLKASALPWYSEAAARIGMITTHAPHLNKFLFATFLAFILASIFYLRNGAQRAVFKKAEISENKTNILERWWFALALLVGGGVAYNQQVITGIEIWYYHYVFYTIPSAYLVISFILWFVVRQWNKKIWAVSIFVLLCASLLFGFFTQWIVYKKSFAYYADLQGSVRVTRFLNRNAEKDCVVLSTQVLFWENFLPAFTHCNVYISGERFVIAPPERFLHNYLTLLRLRGIAPEDIDTYISGHRDEASGFLLYQLQYTLGFPDQKFEELYGRLPDLYREFVKTDFQKELHKYRIDYLLVDSPIPATVAAQLGVLELVFKDDTIALYQFR